MKKTNLLILLLLAILLVFDANAQIFSGGGNGSIDQPFVIRNKMDMDTLALYCNTGVNWSADKHFLLQQNIVGVNQIIGITTYPSDSVKWFQGYFHGNGKTITFNINNISQNNVAMFGGLKGSIDSLTMLGTITGAYNVAGIVGTCGSGAIIRDCINRATITANGGIAGGIVGNCSIGATPNILNCRNYGNITSNGTDNAGGIAGTFYGNITGCFNYGNVTAPNIVGGIISQNRGTIELCGNIGKISGTSKIGGIAGENISTIKNSINIGIIQGNSFVGGIAGRTVAIYTNALITICHNSGIITASSESLGGIAGECYVEPIMGGDPPAPIGPSGTSTISYCLNTGAVIEGSGIVGTLDPYGYSTISSNYYDKQMAHFAGGIGSEDVAGKAEGKLTRDMIYGNLTIGTGWTSNSSLDGYPYITAYDNINYSQAANFNKVASAAMRLDVTNNIDSITNIFYVSKKNYENWTSKFIKVSILDTTATLTSLWNDSIVVTLDSVRKVIPINIVEIPKNNVFNIIVYAAPPEGGTVSGTGTYNENDICTIEAIPNEHYSFGDWEEEPSGNHFPNNPFDITVKRDQTYRANFIIDKMTLTLEMEPDNMGYVFGAGQHDWNSNVNFHASPNYGYHFVNWTDEENNIYSEKIDTTIILDTHRTLTGHFDKDTFEVKVSVSPEILGTATGAGRYPYLDIAKINTEGVDTCYKFNGWYNADTLLSNEPNFDLVVDKDYDLVVYYTAVERVVTLNVNPPEAGTVVSGNGVYDCKPTEIEVEIVGNPGYRFINWTDDITGEQISIKEKFNYTVRKDLNWTANFISDDVDKYSLVLEADPIEGGTLTGEGLYAPAELVNIIATSNKDAGYRFISWSQIDDQGNITSISTDSNYSFNITEHTKLIAFFNNSRNVIVNVNPTYMGTVEGNTSGIYSYNSNLEFNAVPTDVALYEFDYWSDGTDDTISTNALLKFNLISDTNITANFKLITGITETEYWSGFKASPNPVNDILNIEFATFQNININVSLTELNGKNILSLYNGIAEGNFNKQFNISNLSTGVYYIVIDVNGKHFIEKIVVNN